MKAKILIHSRLGRSCIRRTANSNSNTNIVLVEGKSSPSLKGESHHYITNGGRRIYHPSAYSKKGWSNMKYIPSSIRVEVGRDWKPTIKKDFSNRVSYLVDTLSSMGIVTVFSSKDRTYSIISGDKEFCFWDLSISEFRKRASQIIKCSLFS